MLQVAIKFIERIKVSDVIRSVTLDCLNFSRSVGLNSTFATGKIVKDDLLFIGQDNQECGKGDIEPFFANPSTRGPL